METLLLKYPRSDLCGGFFRQRKSQHRQRGANKNVWRRRFERRCSIGFANK